MQEIRNKLHSWYHINKRDLPWRHTSDAYLIWLSEIMLQQTQVAQGLPYYLKFSKRFPTVQELAAAEEEEVLKLWQGLGYYSRARNLHAAAKQVIQEYGGAFPRQYDELIKLKGVGDYTASAVSSFSAGEAKACVDGNVIRVVSRLFGMDVPYDTGEGQRNIRTLALELLDKNDSHTHNQAIMEFGALQCTPKNTDCEKCPLQNKCMAFAKGKVQDLPIKSKKTKVQNLFLYYFVFLHDNSTLIKQRSDSGIWKNMYEFPLLESEKKVSKKELLLTLTDILKEQASQISFSEVYTHILSHRKIQATFIHVDIAGALPDIKDAQKVLFADFENYPVSRLMERFWEDFSE